MALGRPSLSMPFRVAFMQLERLQSSKRGHFDRPDDKTVAQALGSTVPRVQEIHRSLRSTNRRLFDWLVPAAYVLAGPEPALAVLAKDDMLLEGAEISAFLVSSGGRSTVRFHPWKPSGGSYVRNIRGPKGARDNLIDPLSVTKPALFL